jgi:hypothetical protein
LSHCLSHTSPGAAPQVRSGVGKRFEFVHFDD